MAELRVARQDNQVIIPKELLALEEIVYKESWGEEE